VGKKFLPVFTPAVETPWNSCCSNWAGFSISVAITHGYGSACMTKKILAWRGSSGAILQENREIRRRAYPPCEPRGDRRGHARRRGTEALASVGARRSASVAVAGPRRGQERGLAGRATARYARDGTKGPGRDSDDEEYSCPDAAAPMMQGFAGGGSLSNSVCIVGGGDEERVGAGVATTWGGTGALARKRDGRSGADHAASGHQAGFLSINNSSRVSSEFFLYQYFQCWRPVFSLSIYLTLRAGAFFIAKKPVGRTRLITLETTSRALTWGIFFENENCQRWMRMGQGGMRLYRFRARAESIQVSRLAMVRRSWSLAR
jgi:hypothetical protein